MSGTTLRTRDKELDCSGTRRLHKNDVLHHSRIGASSTHAHHLGTQPLDYQDQRPGPQEGVERHSSENPQPLSKFAQQSGLPRGPQSVAQALDSQHQRRPTGTKRIPRIPESILNCEIDD
ncbi:unnamed protein product [Caenorhabditis brenneri]